MKKIFLFMIILSGFILQTNAQNLLSVGVGYFGETGVYPGVVFELEYEQFRSESRSTISRADLGFYSHPRSHDAVFMDIHQGLRRNFKSGFIIESALGLGLMIPYYNEKVYKLTDSGEFKETSRMANPDLMPSITLGLGYDFYKDKKHRRMAWIRPKMFWQYPYNTLALPHLSLQIGYTHTF